MDEIAREYLELGLGLGELEPGLVDAYYGPAETRQAARHRAAGAAELAAQAADLRRRAADLSDQQRALWLDRQLLALETVANRLVGDYVPYIQEVERCFDASPVATAPEVYADARKRIDELLGGSGDLRDRISEHDRQLTVPVDRLMSVLDWLAAELRQACAKAFPMPEGESLTFRLVTNQPWSAYNWYDGGLHSRIEVNTDLPVRAQALIGLMTHEAYPGHHTEHAWKETRLVRENGKAEASLQLINTPEAYVSEGLGEVGGRFVAPERIWQQLFMAICGRAGFPKTSDEAQREWLLMRARRAFRSASGDAALLLHAEGRAREEIIEFLERNALLTREQAEKNLEFIDHPLWRTYIFCYAGGERLLTRWCADAGEVTAQRGRFLRLLTEQLTPSGITAELSREAPIEA